MQYSAQVYLLLVVVAIATVVIARPAVSTKRPEVSDEALEKALNDRRYLMRQIKCALGDAPCDSVGRRLKSLAPLVLRGSCPQCSPAEMKQVQKVLAYVQKNYPKEWNRVLQEYAG